MKANSNPTILGILRREGVGFEAVSEGELDILFSVFADLSPNEVMFTPNFAPRHEYANAAARGVRITIDNANILEMWPEVFRRREIFVRIDPGVGRGHHQHVKTAGEGAKFGVARTDLARVTELSRKLNARIVGLHAHAAAAFATN